MNQVHSRPDEGPCILYARRDGGGEGQAYFNLAYFKMYGRGGAANCLRTTCVLCTNQQHPGTLFTGLYTSVPIPIYTT